MFPGLLASVALQLHFLPRCKTLTSSERPSVIAVMFCVFFFFNCRVKWLYNIALKQPCEERTKTEWNPVRWALSSCLEEEKKKNYLSPISALRIHLNVGAIKSSARNLPLAHWQLVIQQHDFLSVYLSFRFTHWEKQKSHGAAICSSHTEQAGELWKLLQDLIFSTTLRR